MTTPSTDTAQLLTVAQLHWPSGLILAGRVHLEYFATDAAAVHLTVSCTPPGKAPQSQRWVFARQLLVDVVAADTIAGDLDVIVARHNSTTIRVCLHNGEDTIDVLLPLLHVAAFVCDAEAACSLGSIEEETRLSQQIDAAITECLRGAK